MIGTAGLEERMPFDRMMSRFGEEHFGSGAKPCYNHRARNGISQDQVA